jgi:hypothetical protein
MITIGYVSASLHDLAAYVTLLPSETQSCRQFDLSGHYLLHVASRVCQCKGGVTVGAKRAHKAFTLSRQ